MIRPAILQQLIDSKTKPPGSLGVLEALALQVGLVQGTTTPTLQRPTLLVFAGDHGATEAGISAYPRAVTAQMVENFLAGGAAINVFCRQHDIVLRVVDAGADHVFGPHPGLIDAKIAWGTRNYLHEPAMTEEQRRHCFQAAAVIVEQEIQQGCNVMGFGEMGIGNSSAASLMVSRLLNVPLAACVGPGTGVSDIAAKTAILQQALDRHPEVREPLAVLATFGGFEIAQLCGAMLAAYRHGCLLLVDGFIATAALLVAHRLEPALRDHAVFCHRSPEPGHALLLKHLDATPLLDLGMRLGEGSGCAVAYPIIASAVAFLNEMASFSGAGVSGPSGT